MTHSRVLSALAALGLAASVISCGGEDLVLPDTEAAQIVLLQGDGLSGRVGERLPQPLVLQVTDETGRPVEGATVVVTLDGAEAQPGTVQTASDGQATVDVLLGPEVGPTPGLARVISSETESSAQVEFTVNALAASANGLGLIAGNDQSGSVGTALPQPLVVRVTDAFGNPIPGVPITWTAVGGGSVSEQSAVSDADGLSSVIRTLGATAGSQFTEAASPGLAGSPVAFIHTATPGGATGVTIVSGDGQSGPPGAALPQPLVVRVTDGAGNPIVGAPVAWVVTGGGGTLNPPSSTTDASGQASTQWILGPVAGLNSAQAVVSGVGQAGFSATGGAAAPNEVRIVSGDNQTGQAGQRLAASLVVLVLDAGDNAVPGATVTWQVGAGGGSVTPASGSSDASGQASAQWTLGPSPGVNQVTASVAGAAPVTFDATATAGAPSALGLSTQPSASAEIGVPFGRQPVIQLRDAAGNDVAQAGVAVTAAVASGSGSLGGTATQTTDVNGRATFTDLRINGAEGSHTLIFAASGFTSVTSAAINVARVSTTTSITSDAPDPSAPGTPVTVAFSVSAPAGTPTGTVTVTAAGGSESCSADATAGSCVITLSGAGNRELTASYAGSPLFAPSSDSESHAVQAANSPPSFTPGPNQVASVIAGAQTVPGWATNISPGAGETGQTVQFLVQVLSGAELFAVAPSISADGTLSYTPGASGVAQIQVRLQDNAGGNDTSDPATVTFTFSP